MVSGARGDAESGDSAKMYGSAVPPAAPTNLPTPPVTQPVSLLGKFILLLSFLFPPCFPVTYFENNVYFDSVLQGQYFSLRNILTMYIWSLPRDNLKDEKSCLYTSYCGIEHVTHARDVLPNV